MIVVVGPVFPYRGGIADTNNAFVSALEAQGEEVVIFSFSLLYPRILFPGKTPFSDEKTPLSKPAHQTINTLHPLSWWKTAKRIKALNPRLVVFRYWTPWLALSYVVIAKCIAVKKIAWIDNAIPHERKPLDEFLLKSFLKRIDEVLCMSTAVADNLKKQTEKTIHTLFHPINTQLPKPLSKEKALQDLGLSNSHKYLLFFGLIRPYKGLDILIKSLPQLKEKHPNVRLLVVGEPYEPLSTYRTLAARLKVDDMVLFHDRFVSNKAIALWFSACDWVVQPYKSATQSGITPMAIHFSKPSIVTQVGGLAESITVNTGLVSAPNPTALSETIATALLQQKTFSDPAAFEVLRESKSWQYFCTLFSELFKNT